MQKEARSRAADPAQEEVREAKAEWNQYCSELIAKLIYLKRGLNGRGDPKANLPPSKIHQHIPPQVESYLSDVKDTSSRVMQQADRVVELQNQYSDEKMRSFMSYSDQDLDQIIEKYARLWPHSWLGSQLLSGIDTKFEGKPWNWKIKFQETRPIRIKMMRSLTRLRDLVENIEHYISSKDPNGIPRAINAMEILKEVTVITLAENLSNLSKILLEDSPKLLEKSKSDIILDPIVQDLPYVEPVIKSISNLIQDDQYSKLLSIFNNLEIAKQKNDKNQIIKIYQNLLKIINKIAKKPIRSFQFYLEEYQPDTLLPTKLDPILQDLPYVRPALEYLSTFVIDQDYAKILVLLDELETAKDQNNGSDVIKSYQKLLSLINKTINKPIRSFKYYLDKYYVKPPINDDSDSEVDIDLSNINFDQIQSDLQYIDPVVNFILTTVTLSDQQQKFIKTLSIEIEQDKIDQKNSELIGKYHKLLKICNLALKETEKSFESLFNKIKSKIAEFEPELQKIAAKDLQRLFNKQRLKLFSNELDSIKLTTLDFTENIIKEIYKFLDILENNSSTLDQYNNAFKEFIQSLLPLYKSAISLAKVYNSQYEDLRIKKNFKDKSMQIRKVPQRDLIDLNKSIRQLELILQSE